jgi:enoyl-CoA hydratase/carnithine racemase
MNDEILFSEISGINGNLGCIILNRPTALNSLSQSMIIKMSKQLHAWALAKHIKAVVIRGAGDRAFCAGGDLRELYEGGRSGASNITDFFKHEYCLNYQIQQFPKPYIALLDGITMGGGVGVSVHGSHRIATEKFTFAMPETGIGFFPDVGGSYFLPRCPGKTGIYCGLTGARLKAADALYIGVVNHIIPSAKLDEVISTLAATDFADLSKLKDTDASVTIDHSAITNNGRSVNGNGHFVNTPAISPVNRLVTEILNSFSMTTDQPPLAANRRMIDQCFAATTVEEIIQLLQQQKTTWCDETVKVLASKSPTSIKVTLEQLLRGMHFDFPSCMQMEFAMVHHFLGQHDLYEGIRAVVIDKTQSPQWQPVQLKEVTREMVNSYFVAPPSPLPLSEDLYANPAGLHAEPFHLAGES